MTETIGSEVNSSTAAHGGSISSSAADSSGSTLVKVHARRSFKMPGGLAIELTLDSDLGEQLVTVNVEAPRVREIKQALSNGRQLKNYAIAQQSRQQYSCFKVSTSA